MTDYYSNSSQRQQRNSIRKIKNRLSVERQMVLTTSHFQTQSDPVASQLTGIIKSAIPLDNIIINVSNVQPTANNIV